MCLEMMKIPNVLAEKNFKILQLQLLGINMPAEFHLFSVTATIMAWHKFLSLSLSASLHPSTFTTIFVHMCF